MERKLKMEFKEEKMTPAYATIPILMAEDDDGDRLLTRKAMERNKIPNPLVTVENGEELLDYLYRRGKFSTLASAPAPCFILLDLNMPRMDGREALKIMKTDERLKKIPVVILTTSQAEEDILNCYGMGANSYIAKPPTFDGLVKVVQSLKDYWLDVVEFPPEKGFYGHA
jgi:two-component system response regulator